MNINGIEVRRNDVGDWEFLSEGGSYAADEWVSVCDVMGAFGGSGVDQLFDLLGQQQDLMAELTEALDKLANGYTGNRWDVGLVPRLEAARAVLKKAQPQ